MAPLFAGYLDVIEPSRLPKEAIPIIMGLRDIEPYVHDYQNTWPYEIPKDQVKTRIQEAYTATSSILASNKDNGELHLLLGLIGYFGHNLDVANYTAHADDHFSKAVDLLKNDCGVQWLYGMHLYKSTRVAQGVRSLLSAETTCKNQPPAFWEDYALAAYYAVMPGHALLALKKFRELTGETSALDGVIGDPIRLSAEPTEPGKKLPAGEVWRRREAGDSVQFFSYPLGIMFSLPKIPEPDLKVADFTGTFGALQVGLTPRKGKSGVERVPTMQFFTVVPKEGETLQAFSARFVKTDKWQSYQPNLGLQELAWVVEDSDYYKTDGGAKAILIVFESPEPANPGYLLEAPEDSTKYMQKGKFYRYSEYHTRLKGRLFYQIWLETPKAFFNESVEEFNRVLKTVVVE
jgi:hypothetical protein